MGDVLRLVFWRIGRCWPERQRRCRRLQRGGCAGVDPGAFLLDRGEETLEAAAAQILAIGMEFPRHLAAVAVGEHGVLEHMEDDGLQLPDAVARGVEQVVLLGVIELVAARGVGVGGADQQLECAPAPGAGRQPELTLCSKAVRRCLIACVWARTSVVVS